MTTQHSNLMVSLYENARIAFETLDKATGVGVAMVLATIASLCGIPGGQWKMVKREEITQAILDDLAEVIAYGWGMQGESSQLKTLARRSTAGMVKQGLGHWALGACKVGISYLESGKDGETKYAAQYAPQGSEGLRIGVSITLPVKTGSDPLPDPTGTPDEIRESQKEKDLQARQEKDAERAAQALENKRLAEAIQVATLEARAMVASEIAHSGAGDVALGSFVGELSGNIPAIVAAWSDRITDSDLVRIAKSRGFSIRRKVATA